MNKHTHLPGDAPAQDLEVVLRSSIRLLEPRGLAAFVVLEPTSTRQVPVKLSCRYVGSSSGLWRAEQDLRRADCEETCLWMFLKASRQTPESQQQVEEWWKYDILLMI